MPKLVDDWKEVLKRAWSVRFAALAAVSQTVLLAWPTFMLDIWNVMPDALRAHVPQNVAAVIPLILTAGAIAARVAVQKEDGDSDGE